MKVLVVDDEKLARDRLIRLLHGVDGVTEVAQAADADEALAVYDKFSPDVVLLDIQMPGDNGLDLGKQLKDKSPPPAIVFTTAFSEYALESFESGASGYLIKPVRKEKLASVLGSLGTLSKVQQSGAPKTEEEQFIYHKVGATSKLIPLKDVFFFRSEDKYVAVHHKNGEALIEDSLRSLEEKYEDKLVRVHRNALACLRHVSGMKKENRGGYVMLFNNTDKTLAVSRRNAGEVNRMLKAHRAKL